MEDKNIEESSYNLSVFYESFNIEELLKKIKRNFQKIKTITNFYIKKRKIIKKKKKKE